tara:strand:+ start:60 stop:689 length:630 start_codon:yes stop_codon:yes gene_type:complete
MRKIFSLVLILLVFLKISAQKNNDLIIDSAQKNDLRQSFSIGWSNPITSTLSLFDENPRERIGILVDYQLFISKNIFYRFHTKFSANNQKNIFALNNFLISIEKGRFLINSEKLNLGHGSGPYLRCNIYRGQAVSGAKALWSADYYGIGWEYFMFLDYLIKEKIHLNVITNLNLGIHQNYDRSGNIDQEYWSLKMANQQLISIAIKKYL